MHSDPAETFLDPSFPFGGIAQPSLTGGDSLPALFNVVSFHCSFSNHIKQKLKFVNEDLLDNLVQTVLLTRARQSDGSAFFKEELHVYVVMGNLCICAQMHPRVCMYNIYSSKLTFKQRANHLCSWCATVV